MSGSPRVWLAAIAACVLACGPTTFVCEERSQCVREQMQGRCEPTARCSYRDETCASGWRYGANAGDGFARECVAPEMETTTSAAATGSTSTEGSTGAASSSSESGAASSSSESG